MCRLPHEIVFFTSLVSAVKISCQCPTLTLIRRTGTARNSTPASYKDVHIKKLSHVFPYMYEDKLKEENSRISSHSQSDSMSTSQTKK